MISNKMLGLVKNSSVIRAMFEEGKRLSELHGEENVFDFSLGNPSVKPPVAITEAIIDIVQSEDANLIHGYMNNAGYEDVRRTIADSINRKQQTKFSKDNIIMTVGAAGGLNVIFKALLNPEDEVIVFAPYFGEYRAYGDNYNAKLVTISPNVPSFQPNLKELESKITNRTKAIIINSPNNPTGVVYSEDTIKELAKLLTISEEKYGTSIYIISDEPYRELVYDGVIVPYLTKYYHNTIVGYSFSKSLSLPGERIGYLVIPDEVDDYQDVFAAANTANRILGYVNAPSLMQRVVARCIEAEVDLSIYNKNKELLYNSLIEYGYTCAKPEGAFYLFIKAMEEDDTAFAKEAKKYNILIVPGSSFGCPGYCRIAYCVDYAKIEKSLEGFKKLAMEYQNK